MGKHGLMQYADSFATFTVVNRHCFFLVLIPAFPVSGIYFMLVQMKQSTCGELKASIQSFIFHDVVVHQSPHVVGMCFGNVMNSVGQ